MIVLAGGKGSRLQSVLKGGPKPLADINGQPFINILIHNWVSDGVKDFIFSLNYEAQKIIDHVEGIKGDLLNGCSISYVIEDEPLGTGGALKYVIEKEKLKDKILVANADTYLSSGISNMVYLGQPSVACVKVNDVSRFGTLVIGEEGDIIGFNEKTKSLSEGIINAGLYLLDVNHFSFINEYRFSLETDLFPILVRNKLLKACILDVDFLDIGVPDDYYKFCNKNLINGK